MDTMHGRDEWRTMDPRDKLFAFIFSSFILLILLSIFMVMTGCAEPIQATGGVKI